MKNTRVIPKRTSHKTLWFGLLGAIVVIVGSILFGYAQGQKKENERMNPTKAVPSDAELRTKLTKDQYRVTRECGTETAYQNAYWDNHHAGIYVDLITGEPLFSSQDKFDSGTGWPSFTSQFQKTKWLKKEIPLSEWSGLRSAQAKAIRTSVMCFRMAPRQRVNVTA